jgi:hypothetical protein
METEKSEIRKQRQGKKWKKGRKEKKNHHHQRCTVAAAAGSHTLLGGQAAWRKAPLLGWEVSRGEARPPNPPDPGQCRSLLPRPGWAWLLPWTPSTQPQSKAAKEAMGGSP